MSKSLLESVPPEIGNLICSFLNLEDLLMLLHVCKTSSKWVYSSAVAKKQFVYKHDFDTNGILYWLGTSRGTTKYANPFVLGKVNVSASHVYANFVGRTPYWCRNVGDSKTSFYQIDFGPFKRVTPSYYSIAYGNDSSNWEPRNWNLLGSSDAKEWHILSRHCNDVSLEGAFSTASWPINLNGQFKNASFRYFRLEITGPNKTGKFHTFFVACFEIYGTLHFFTSDKDDKYPGQLTTGIINPDKTD